jgi:peptidoglycan/xylan/chitin deacetylase (PgdA/CDA1 family)
MAAHELISPRFAIPGVPVFMYHDVCGDSESGDRYAVPLAMFREHLSFLCEQGFAVEDLPALAGASSGRRAVLTFDDGLSSHYERAFPALLERGLTATFFVTTGRLGSSGFLSWSQLREMSAAGMTIGSHGHEHIDYCGLEAAAARSELYGSRVALEDGLGRATSTFSAPYGFLNRSLIESARQAGFHWICASIPWLASAHTNVVSRLAIYHDTDVRRFSALASRSALPLLVRRARNALLYIPKQFLRRGAPELLGVQVRQEIE